MTNPLQIKQPDKVLNKEQRRFNTLVKKIDLLREQISLVQNLDVALRRIGAEKIQPVEDQTDALMRDWVFALHQQASKSKLSHKLSNKFSLIMLEEIEGLLQHEKYWDDAELQEMYKMYEGSGRTYEEVSSEIDLEEKKMAAEMMEAMFGINIAPEDVDNPEIMQEKIRAKQAEFSAAAPPFSEKQTRRNKTPAQIAAEERRMAAEAAVKKTAKQIYLELVRHFHPDKEADEGKRLEKTEIMKQITVAYQADDHLRLMELQMNLFASREHVFENFDNAQLKYLNKTLQQQVAELQQELYFSSPEANGNAYGHLFSISRTQMLRNVESYISSLKKTARDIQKNLTLIRDEKVFKEFVQFYQLDDFWG